MRRLNDLVAVIGFSIGGLLLFYIPDFIPNDDLSSAFSYILIALMFFYATWAYQLPSLAYFRLPEISIPSIAALVVVGLYSWNRITSDYAITKPLWPTITGLMYLFAIGAGEELLSRGFAFGVLRKYGAFFAVTVSSIIFGLMHLNVYLGDSWDPVQAYWHCLSAAGFGALAAVVMIACRSIIAPIVMHALYNWTVVFSKPDTSTGPVEPWEFDPLWQTIKDSFAEVLIDMFFLFFLLSIIWMARVRKFPKFLMPVVLKLGFVEEEKSVASGKGSFLGLGRDRD
jgi:membrane protease YdiL (CAAX protease family)